MAQEDNKIVQISGSGDVVFALSSEGKIYVGTLDEKLGFEWRALPALNPQRVKTVPISIMAEADADGSGPVFAPPPGGEIKTAALLREEEPAEEKKPEPAKAEAPKADAIKIDPLAQKK